MERHRWLDRTAGDGGSGSERQVRRNRRDCDDEGCQPGQDPAGRHAVYVPSRITIIESVWLIPAPDVCKDIGRLLCGGPHKFLRSLSPDADGVERLAARGSLTTMELK